MLVKEMMNPGVVSIQQEDSVALAARLLSRHNVGVLPVCGQDGRLRAGMRRRCRRFDVRLGVEAYYHDRNFYQRYGDEKSDDCVEYYKVDCDQRAGNGEYY